LVELIKNNISKKEMHISLHYNAIILLYVYYYRVALADFLGGVQLYFHETTLRLAATFYQLLKNLATKQNIK